MKKYITLFILTLFLLIIFKKEPKKQNITPQSNNIQNTINQVNKYNKSIKNFISDDVDIKITNNVFQLKGCILYEKNRNFRLLINSVAGKEIDIGSNDQYLWFWSKRIKPQALYYALHEDIYLTRLKTPFHPIWMMESLGLNEINLKTYYYNQQNNLIYLYYLETNTLNEPVIRVIAIDSNVNKIIKQYVFQRSIMICSVDISYINNLPSEIKYKWYEENTSMTLVLNNVQKNMPINNVNWHMPNMSPKIDMAKN